jgi:phage FluMu protein Com
MDRGNYGLSNTQLTGDAGDNYLCGNCAYLLAEKIPREIKDRIGINTVRCPNCKKVNKVEWYSMTHRVATLSARFQQSANKKIAEYLTEIYVLLCLVSFNVSTL